MCLSTALAKLLSCGQWSRGRGKGTQSPCARRLCRHRAETRINCELLLTRRCAEPGRLLPGPGAAGIPSSIQALVSFQPAGAFIFCEGVGCISVFERFPVWDVGNRPSVLGMPWHSPVPGVCPHPTRGRASPWLPGLCSAPLLPARALAARACLFFLTVRHRCRRARYFLRVCRNFSCVC